MTTAPVAVAVDDPTTWPGQLLNVVAEAAEDLRDTTEFTSDLRPNHGALVAIRGALDGVAVRAFHSTRLLEVEHDHIRENGLEFATPSLFERKVRAALDGRHLTADEAAELLATTMPLDGSAGTRANQVCAVAGLHGFRDDVHGVLPLLTSWGGEVLYFAHGGDDLERRLRTIGQPAIIEIAVPAAAAHDHWFPDLENCLIGAALGLTDVGSDIFIRTSPVLASSVLATHTPGSPWWAQFPGLPSA